MLVDTAGRLQNKAGLMDELGKVKRVVEKQAPVTEVLLVLDATTGQNGLQQARVFREVVDVTGHRADQARRVRQGRHRGRRAARARRAGEAGRASARGRTTWRRSTPRRSSTPCWASPTDPGVLPVGRTPPGPASRHRRSAQALRPAATPRSVNSTRASTSSTPGIGRCVMARIARRPPSHWTALSTSMSGRTSPRCDRPLERGAGVGLPPFGRGAVERRRCGSSRTDSAMEVRRSLALGGVHEQQHRAVALGEVGLGWSRCRARASPRSRASPSRRRRGPPCGASDGRPWPCRRRLAQRRRRRSSCRSRVGASAPRRPPVIRSSASGSRGRPRLRRTGGSARAPTIAV